MFRQSIVFHFSNSNIGFNALYRSCAKEYFNKEQKQIRKKTNKKTSDPIKSLHFIKKNET